jgi:hypothetical protein
LTASTALAARGHEFKESFAEPCPALEVPCGPGKLKEPSAVAVNEASGDVYVLDQGNARVQRFSATGTYLGQFDGGATFEDEGTTEPTTEAGHGGNPGEVETGPLAYTSQPQVSGVAVDNACALQTPPLTGSECEAFDESAGSVYVLDRGHQVIDKFSAAGEYIGQITEANGEPFNFGEGGGLAVDTEGHLVVFQQGNSFNGVLDRFSNTAANAFLAQTQVSSPPGRGFLAPGLALDGEGNVYLRSRLVTSLVEKFNSTGSTRLIERLDEEDSSGLAADQRSGDSYLDNVSTLAAFGPTGTELQRLAVPGEHGAGVAVDSAPSSETVYVVDSQAGVVDVYSPQQPSAPTVESESLSAVTADSADLEGLLNPRGAATTYTFQYGPCPSVAACPTSPYTLSAPLPPLPIGADFEIHPVSVHVQGLAANTVYHFRLAAENSLSTEPTLGVGLIFTTQRPGEELTLPDGRQYQLVSPPDKLGSLILPIEESGVVQAAADGRAIAYVANAPIEPSPPGAYSLGTQVLSARGPAAWASQNLIAPHVGLTGPCVGCGLEPRFFSEDLSASFLQPFGAFDPSISPEATESTAFLRTDYLNGDPSQLCQPKTMSCYRPLVTGAPGLANVPEGTVFGDPGGCPPAPICGPEFEDATPDAAHAVLSSGIALTETPIPGRSLYAWDSTAPPAQQLQLLSLLPGPGAEPALKPKLGFHNRNTRGALSADGRLVVWEDVNASSEPLALYDRDLGREETLQLDRAEPACEAALECQSGAGKFQFASADGSRVFFTDVRKLTEDSGSDPSSTPPKADLYECRIVFAAGGDECELTDLTPETGGESADVQGQLPGASGDAKWVYFVANGVLTSEPDSQGEVAQPGECATNAPAAKTCNLYLLHAGQIRLVTVLSAADSHDWQDALRGMPARVSPNGQWLALMSQRSLTGYDNRDAASGQPAAEVYLYSAASDQLVCASCQPSGARPVGFEYAKLQAPNGIVGGPRDIWEVHALVAANVPGWTGNADDGSVTRHQPRYLSDAGRLFFNSGDGLVSQDANGTQDVYQYEPSGVGSCTEVGPTFSVRNGGCIDLISSGASSLESAFLDASQSGNDVFFLTSAQLVRSDIDHARDVYDAHVCTAEVPCLPEPPAPPPACQGDSCQLPAVPPNDQTPGSLSFQGAGNLTECPKGKVKKSGKCVARKHHKAKHKKAHRRAAKSGGGHR